MAENVRFGKTTEEICKNLVENSTPSATKSATNFAVNVFRKKILVRILTAIKHLWIVLYGVIKPSTLKLSSKYHYRPRNFASRSIIHFSDNFSVSGIITRYNTLHECFVVKIKHEFLTNQTVRRVDPIYVINIYISISANLKICNFLDFTLNLTVGTYYPSRKPNNETLYIDTNCNHPPTIIKHLPAAIGRRISDISSNKELFNKAKPHYESSLKRSGHDEILTYTERKKPAAHTAQNSRKNRQRNVIWFNPPYSMNVQTNIGRVSELRQQTLSEKSPVQQDFQQKQHKS